MSKNLLVLLVVVVLSGIMIGCASNPVGDGYGDGGQVMITQGWNDDGTEFIAMGEGMWSEENNNAPTMMRRKEARAQAKLDAQSQVVEKFVGVAISGASITKVDKAGAKGFIEAKFSGFIKGGSIHKEKWSSEEGMTLWYKVTGKNLKKDLEVSMRDLTDDEKTQMGMME